MLLYQATSFALAIKFKLVSKFLLYCSLFVYLNLINIPPIARKRLILSIRGMSYSERLLENG